MGVSGMLCLARMSESKVSCLSVLLLLSICFALPAEEASCGFGQRQVAQMLDDRPSMKDVFDEEDPLVKWLCACFAGSGPESRVYWNAEEPASGFSAEHSRRYSVYPAQIRVVSSQQLSGLDKWIAIVFEMHNLRGALDFAQLDRLAFYGRIESAQYVDECVDLELDAVGETAQFLEAKVAAKTLQRSKLFSQFQEVVQFRKAGKKYDTGLKHRSYYEAAYDRLKSSNPQNEENK